MNYYSTSSCFLPNSPHLMKKNVVEGALLSVHRRQIKSYLARHIAISYPSQSKERRQDKHYRTMPQFCSVSKRDSVQKKERPVHKKVVSPHKNVMLYNLLEKVKQLKREDEKMASNPFYRVQRQRRHMRLMPHRTVTEISAINSGVSGQELMEKKVSTSCQPIFENENVSRAIEEQFDAKTRNKSQTFVYYQIKSYFQRKYGLEKEDKEAVA